MWWSILAFGGLVAGGVWWWSTREAPQASYDPDELQALFLQVGGTLRVVEGICRLTPTPEGGVLEVHAEAQAGLEHPVHLTITRSARDDRVEGELSGRPVRFGGRLDPVELTIERDTGPVAACGLQLALLETLQEPFVRESTIVLAVQAARGGPVLEAFSEPDALPALPWTLDSATRFAERTLTQRGWADEVTVVSPGLLELTHADGGRSQLQLHNVFPLLQGVSPTEGQERLVAHLESTVAGLAGRTPIAREQLMVRVYPGPSPFTLALPDQAPVAFASVPLAVDLTAVFVQDSATSLRPLRDEEVAALEPEPSAWLPLAQRNLLRSLSEVRIVGSGPVFMITAGGDYENALVLLPELWDVVEPLLDGPPLVAIPARDLLFVTGDTGPASVAALAGLVDDTRELAYPVSPGVYRVTNGGQMLERLA